MFAIKATGKLAVALKYTTNDLKNVKALINQYFIIYVKMDLIILLKLIYFYAELQQIGVFNMRCHQRVVFLCDTPT